MDLVNGKVAVVTGSTQGLGAGIASTMAAEGARVVVTGRQVDKGKAVVQSILAAGGQAEYCEMDLATEGGCIELLDFAEHTYGRIDILVNNHAPVKELMSEGLDSSLVDTDTSEWNFLLNIGLSSIYFMARHGIPRLLANGGGAIVNISSLASEMAAPGMPMYSTIKSAMDGLTRAIAVDYGKRGIRCNAVSPHCVMASELTELVFANEDLARDLARCLMVPRRGQVDDIANLVTFLASDSAAGYIQGQVIRCDGGASVALPIPALQSGFADGVASVSN